jgi:hypothetical protein
MIRVFAQNRLSLRADANIDQTLSDAKESRYFPTVDPLVRCFVILRAWAGRNLQPESSTNRP